MIPMVNLKAQHDKYKEEINHEILKVLDSTQFINGPNVSSLEEEIKSFFNVKKVKKKLITCEKGLWPRPPCR